MVYFATLIQTHSNRHDGSVSIRLTVDSKSVPSHLSDFIGGEAEIDEGVGSPIIRTVINGSDDARHLNLTFSSGEVAELYPVLVRDHGTVAALPLKEGQVLKYYVQDREIAFMITNAPRQAKV